MSSPSDQKAVREVFSCGCACFTSYVLAAAPSGVHTGEGTYPIVRQMAKSCQSTASQNEPVIPDGDSVEQG